MAKYSAQFSSVPFAVTALGSAISTTATNSFMGLIGGVATGGLKVSEIFIGGEAATSSQVASMAFSRATQVATTLTAGLATIILTDIFAAPPTTGPSVGTQWVTTNAPIASANALLHLSYNAYGGIVRWVSSPDQNITAFGTGAYSNGTQGVGGELILTQIAGTASTMSGHILFETL